MIIDFHTHAFTESVAGKAISNLSKTSGIVPLTDGTVKNLIEFMNDEGVDKSVILPVVSTWKPDLFYLHIFSEFSEFQGSLPLTSLTTSAVLQ